MSNLELPVVDLDAQRAKVATDLRVACERDGFFYVSNHGVSESLQTELEVRARAFFARPLEEKMAIAMDRGGRAWRGYFPVGGELTSGVPDSKEGIYFGTELALEDPRVQACLPLHGPNLFPAEGGFREAVLSYMRAMTELGHRLMAGIAESLGLEAREVSASLLRDPLTLFRIFNYPAEPAETPRWGVGEHTDYGLLTILKQSDESGLQVRTARGWIEAPPLPGTFLCNIGDMLECMTYGRYRSTPHRVKNTSARDRLSLPFFFDPSFDADVRPLVPRASLEETTRWDGRSVFDFRGTYGEYLLDKVSKVFPALATSQLRREGAP
ncbi:isopenicillin N synthase family oxygenase [Pendulispora brunnea]|uniref:2-oxoglutarate-dependent ethylene/succinate-forming enzyme n=1 Tax=Pendulispora brunnea TaxID=2905690 RepID=A0ABZ2K8D7_9BACT